MDPIEQPALKTVPVNLLRKRKQLNKERVAKAIQKKIKDKKRADKAKVNFKRAEYFVNENYKSDMNTKRIDRLKHKVVKIPESVKVLFLMRIAKLPGPMPLKVRKILQHLRLSDMHNAVLVQCSDQMVEKIKIIDPYITWGYPSLRSIHSLVFKYGYGTVKGEKSALSSNKLVEDSFSAQGLLCLEDLVQELFSAGAHFTEISTFMRPFQLLAPKGGFKRSHTHFSKNGSWGGRAEKINAMIRKML